MTQRMIETKGLTKQYSNGKGCKSIDLSVGQGEVFAFLGPNGAGKSTLIKTLVGLLHPTGGTAEILGLPLGHIDAKKKIGYLPELFKYQDWMTGSDLLKFHAALYKLDKKAVDSKIQEVLEIVKMTGSEKYKIGTYSKGMQQRIGMASALLCDPQLIFLDEPTSALDPIGRKEVRDIILELKNRGTTVFLNSHLLSEVEQVCDSAAIISHGQIIKQGKMAELLKGQQTLEIQVSEVTHTLLSALETYDENYLYDGEWIRMTLKATDEVPQIAALIIQNGGQLHALKPNNNRLEELFIELVEKGEQ